MTKEFSDKILAEELAKIKKRDEKLTEKLSPRGGIAQPKNV